LNVTTALLPAKRKGRREKRHRAHGRGKGRATNKKNRNFLKTPTRAASRKNRPTGKGRQRADKPAHRQKPGTNRKADRSPARLTDPLDQNQWGGKKGTMRDALWGTGGVNAKENRKGQKVESPSSFPEGGPTGPAGDTMAMVSCGEVFAEQDLRGARRQFHRQNLWNREEKPGGTGTGPKRNPKKEKKNRGRFEDINRWWDLLGASFRAKEKFLGKRVTGKKGNRKERPVP